MTGWPSGSLVGGSWCASGFAVMTVVSAIDSRRNSRRISTWHRVAALRPEIPDGRRHRRRVPQCSCQHGDKQSKQTRRREERLIRHGSRVPIAPCPDTQSTHSFLIAVRHRYMADAGDSFSACGLSDLASRRRWSDSQVDGELRALFQPCSRRRAYELGAKPPTPARGLRRIGRRSGVRAGWKAAIPLTQITCFTPI
jgi:hypothetical protein